MAITDRIKSIFTKPNPTLRDTRRSDYAAFVQNYGWAFRSNITTRDTEAIKMAMINPYVRACVDAIAEATVGNGFTILSRDGTVGIEDGDSKYVEQLFNNPEGIFRPETFNTLFLKISKSLSLYGEAFVEILEQPSTKQLAGFKFIPSTLIDFDEKKNRYYFKRQPGITFEPGEIIHIMNPSITYENRDRGDSPIDAIALAIRSIYSALTYNNDTLNQKGLSVNHVLEFDSEVSDENYETQIELLADMAQEHKRGGMIALRGAKFTELNSHKDIDYKDLIDTCRDIILTVFRVPPAKVSIIESGNLGGGTGVSQDKTFKDMIRSKSQLIEDAFNKVLLQRGYRYRFQFNEIDLEDKKERAQTEATLINAGIFTINEVRESYELEPLEGGNESLPLRNLDIQMRDDEAEMDKELLNSLYTSDVLTKWYNP